MIVAGLLALAVVASLFLIFSDSVQLLRVGLVLALWAATLGAIAMTKYRRESALDKAKVNDLQTVYELQLEREISARREYELTVEKRVRSEVRADSEELAALRAELSALRKNLEVLFDGAIPAERTALRADSTRVQELAGSYQPAASGLYIPGSGGNSSPTGARSYGQSSAGGFASPYDDPVTAETAVVPSDYAAYSAERDELVHNAPAQAEHGPSGTYTVDGYPRDDSDSDMNAETEIEPEPAAEAAVESEPEPTVEPEPEPTVEPEPAAEPEEAAESEDEPSGAHSSGLTVAQIMANMNAGAATPSSGGGRRRRAE